MPELPPESAAAHFEAIIKGIADVDTLIQGLLDSVPPIKPWQRQLLLHLSEADRKVEILRLVISLERDPQEVAEAADQLRRTLQGAYGPIAHSRADDGTKAAMKIALHLAKLVTVLLSP